MRALLIDDDFAFCDIFKSCFIEQIKKADMQMEFEYERDIEKVLCSMKEYDVYFIDIEMPELDGIELVSELRRHCIDREFVFVSAYQKYIQKSMFVKPRAFIRKQNLEKDLQETLLQLKEIFLNNAEKLTIYEGKKPITIQPKKLIYIKSESHYLELILVDEERKVLRMDMRAMEELFKERYFVRIHASYMVNLNYVSYFTRQNVVLLDKTKLPIGVTYRERITSCLMRWFRNGEN